MSLRYLSVCSGIEAASVAWHGLGFEPVAFSEIEPFPCRVLAQHFPRVPNLGDMTKFQEWPHLAIDLLVGGTPCQSFSVAGLRKGLADPRGNLMLTWLAIADRYRPQWLVWENVPGVLSSTSHDAPDPCPPPPPLDLECDGAEMETEDEYDSEEVHAFNSFLAGLSELGYGWAFVVRDAQYVRVDSHPRAVPQRRRRVFVVGHSGGQWQRAAAVLFDAESLSGNPPPRRQAGEGAAPTISARPTGGGGLGTDFDLDGGLIAADVAPTLNAHFGDKQGLEYQHINSGCGMFVAHALRAEGFDASEDGTGRGVPVIAFPERMSATQAVAANEHAPTLQSRNPTAVATSWSVRRLTPTECERLQGFPDGWTDVPHKGKPAADGPRYKALGNSMAVNCMRWIGQRIQQVATIATRPGTPAAFQGVEAGFVNCGVQE